MNKENQIEVLENLIEQQKEKLDYQNEIIQKQTELIKLKNEAIEILSNKHKRNRLRMDKYDVLIIVLVVTLILNVIELKIS